MQNSGEIRTIQKYNQQHWFGVWGVHNHYHKLELQAQAGAEFNLGNFMLIIASGLLATSGCGCYPRGSQPVGRSPRPTAHRLH